MYAERGEDLGIAFLGPKRKGKRLVILRFVRYPFIEARYQTKSIRSRHCSRTTNGNHVDLRTKFKYRPQSPCRRETAESWAKLNGEECRT